MGNALLLQPKVPAEMEEGQASFPVEGIQVEFSDVGRPLLSPSAQLPGSPQASEKESGSALQLARSPGSPVYLAGCTRQGSGLSATCSCISSSLFGLLSRAWPSFAAWRPSQQRLPFRGKRMEIGKIKDTEKGRGETREKRNKRYSDKPEQKTKRSPPSTKEGMWSNGMHLYLCTFNSIQIWRGQMAAIRTLYL